jgi:DNA-binding NtrC family response regulator
MERRHIRAVLDMTGHHLTRAAQTLGISRTTLYKKIAEYGLEGDST